MHDKLAEPLWKQAFPDYGALDFELPDGFVDASWRNEACPSFMNKDLDVHLYADYRDPAKREHPESRRFTLLETVDGQFGSSDVVLADTDSFDEVVAAIESRRAERSPGMR